MKIKAAVSDFLIEQRIRGNSPYTIAYYSRLLSDFMSYLVSDIDICDLTVPLCKGFYVYLSDMDISSVSIQSYCRGLRAFLSYLYHSDYINVDLCQNFRLPKARKPVVHVLTDSELIRIYGCFDASSVIGLRNICIISLMLDSGLRLSEVVNIISDHVFLQERYLIVLGKGNKERVVPIGSVSHGFLFDYSSLRCCNCNSFFTNVDGSPLTVNAVKLMFQKLKFSSGVERVHPHLLRHTFATRYLENGGNIYDLQQILGHSSLEMCKNYLHMSSAHILDTFDSLSPLDIINIRKKENR